MSPAGAPIVILCGLLASGGEDPAPRSKARGPSAVKAPASTPEAPAAEASADPVRDVARFAPCSPGLSIEYRVEAGTGTGVSAQPYTMTETVRGPGREQRTCVLDERTVTADRREQRDAWVRELLPDRITNAGWIDHPVAMRAPMLKAPLEKGRRWTFNTSFFEIVAVEETVSVPAGTFTGCVRVVERDPDGGREVVMVFAPGVGVIESSLNGRASRAIRVVRAEGPKPRSVKRPPGARESTDATR